MSKLPKEVRPYFEKAGWYEGRKIDFQDRIRNEFGEYPKAYIEFMSEFIDLYVQDKGIHKYTSSLTGKEKELKFHRYLGFDLMYDMELMYDEDGEEGGVKIYSDLIGKRLFPIAEADEGFTVVVDEDLCLYIYNLGILGCVKVHENPYEGLRCVLKNDLYTTCYILGEEGEEEGKWFKR